MTGGETPPFSLAVIADAHFHDIAGDYGLPGVPAGERRLTLYSWARTRESTRVFNESAAALSAALEQVAARGIRHVVLLGDYTDDGQRRTTESLARLLTRQEEEHGLRFYALPGNHDVFGPFGRHRSGDFLRADGRSVLVTSDGREPPPGAVVTPDFRCEGLPAGLLPMARFGYFRRPEFLHWETPFGLNDAPEARSYEAVSADGRTRHRLMDASYLVEPEDGLWLMMIDANVFEPRNGVFKPRSKRAFIDSTAAGWNAMLRLKPFILTWMADVAARAKATGKTLLTFSHYPVIDPLDDREGYEPRLFPGGTILKRRPEPAVAEAVSKAGIDLHFSGHWHVAGQSRRGDLVNVAVPSLCGYPPGFCVVEAKGVAVAVETVDLSALPLDADIMALYGREAARTGGGSDAVSGARDYGEFLRLHTQALVRHRYFPREWPAEVVSAIEGMRLSDLLADERTRPAGDVPPGCDADEAVIALIADWYCLRQGGALALAGLGERRIALLEQLARLYAETPEASTDRAIAAYLGLFFRAGLFHLERARGPAWPAA
ncbi:metallophosphoesterase family protein [Allorhizobium borbori]|uniref:3',5'-cyclic AMP phosphodiesterase CpdA n=1 Tax=Allorhizobium borbori TaxID=485907 RepID=A0A7W6K190_9HYPH|nr:metallophosphoesterase [Allorhizobium borbori]MBB4103301.1 3',5'-cyclic AMP phosphodiesterase CpdA [Allorhizobium borbori]